MKVIVDADACPVKGIIEKVSQFYHLEVILVSNYHHQIESDYAQVVIVDGSSQAADMVIANYSQPGDIVVTQDYGLAAIVLAKQAQAIHPAGNIYNKENIDGLLMQRYVAQKARQANKRTAGPRKRTSLDDRHFEQQFEKLIMEQK